MSPEVTGDHREPTGSRSTSGPLPFCVYVLRSEKDGLLYIGFTADLPRRLAEHHAGRSKATAPRRPLTLVYCEFHASEADARRREGYFKTTSGKTALKRMLRTTLDAATEHPRAAW